MHIGGLQRMGAEVTSEHGYLIARADDGLHGATIWLDFPSVGATETLLMAAVTARGRTVIDNAAREPEIVDICTLLVEMGASIGGIGSSTLEIEGVAGLVPVEHATVADRIVAGTWAVAAAMTRGDITVRRAHPEHLEIALDKLATAGATVTSLDDGFRVEMQERPRAVDIVTLPYPGFPTDLQPQFIALNAIADGAALVTENPLRRGSDLSMNSSASAPMCRRKAIMRWCADVRRSAGHLWKRRISEPEPVLCSPDSWRMGRPSSTRCIT
jgi:UDP-N-acetylglucosamine 1-carboxyvinyltransferase